jgi:hypothetical protein
MLPCINTVNSGKPLVGNPEPSLRRNTFEGATTKTNDPERIMKSVETMPVSKRGDVLTLTGDDVKDSLICIVIYKGVKHEL